jgi:hypothetical protein
MIIEEKPTLIESAAKSSTTSKVFEQICKHFIGIAVELVAHAARHSSWSSAPRPGGTSSFQAFFAELVIYRALLFVVEDIVGLGNFLEFFLRLLGFVCSNPDVSASACEHV